MDYLCRFKLFVLLKDLLILHQEKPVITLNPQTEAKLEAIAAQSCQSVQQLIESFILDYQDEQDSIKRADESYAEYLQTGVSHSLEQIKLENDLAHSVY